MAVIVKQSTTLSIDSVQGALDYLYSLYIQASAPYVPGTQLNILDRSALPADLGEYNVGIQVFSPQELTYSHLYVLTSGGLYTVATVPKAHVTIR